MAHTWHGTRLPPVYRDDDENGHYQFELGENLAPRFKIMRKFGEGTFGQVLECWDRKRKDYVAVKIIRNIQVGEWAGVGPHGAPCV